MKKLLAIITAVCLSLFVGLMFIACDGSKAEDSKFYVYDAESGEYDLNNYIEIRGGSCNLVSQKSSMTVSYNGTIENTGNAFVITISFEEEGVTCTIVLKGEKESFGVLRVDSETFTVGDETETLREISYFCNKGCAPKDPQTTPGTVTDGDKYYEYDPTTELYTITSYIAVDGIRCTFAESDETFGDIVADGTIIFVGNDFVLDCTAQVLFAEMRVTLTGVREKPGVLRVNSTAITILGTTEYSSYIYYFCMDGEKPDNPVLDQEPITGAEYTVVFNANGGSFGQDTAVAERTTGGRVSLPEVAPTRDGYVFIEYNQKSDGTGYTVREGELFTRDETVYAIWKREVKVTLMNGVEIVDVISVAEGVEIGEMPVPKSPNGYVFKGWFTAGDYPNQYNSFTTVSYNTTLYATWRTADELTSYAESSASWTEDGHLYIHYWRNDHYCGEEFLINSSGPLYHTWLPSQTYGDWVLWAWPKNGEGRMFYPARVDRTGAVYDIDLNYLFHDGGWDPDNHNVTYKDVSYKDCDIGIMFVMGSSMSTDAFWKNDGGNIYITRSTIEMTPHVFFRQGETSNPKYMYA